MIEIGKFNVLEAARSTDFGMYFKDEENREVLLPNKYVPDSCRPGDKINLFIYLDSEDRIVATTRSPKVQIGEFASLQVKDVNQVGAFLDWGLEKDLFVPFKEQRRPLRSGEYVVVYVYLDEETDRISASTKLNKFLLKKVEGISEGDSVSALISSRTDLGFTCVVENKYSGLIYENETFQKLRIGDQVSAFVKKRRDDGKIDLSLQKSGYEKVGDLPETILKKLKLQAGFIPVNSKTDPDVIYNLFGVSKKTFKMAIGALYKERKIIITDDGIKLAPKD